jgi:hypothetical protein
MRLTFAVCSILALIEARRGGGPRPIGRDPPAPSGRSSDGGSTRSSRNTSTRSSRRSSSSSSYSHGYTPTSYSYGYTPTSYSYGYTPTDQGYNYDPETVTLNIIDGINALGEGLQEIADKFYENPEAFLTEIEQNLVQGC